MPDNPAVIGEVPGGTQKNSGQVHQFAEREIGEKRAHKKQMNIEKNPDPFRGYGLKGDQTEGQFLGADDIHLQEISHEDAGGRNGQDQEERKVVCRKRNIAHLRNNHSSEEQKGQGERKDSTAQHESRDREPGERKDPDFHETVQAFQDVNEGGDGFGEEAEVPQ